jgi:hypothetical protein
MEFGLMYRADIPQPKSSANRTYVAKCSQCAISRVFLTVAIRDLEIPVSAVARSVCQTQARKCNPIMKVNM